MVKIPYIKIPGVRVGSIGPASNIGTGGATPAPPAPITYLTQWKIVGNSEVHTLPYPDGVVLPDGYKRCEYLESDGTAYIELPFGFDKTDEMYAKVKFNNTYESERHIISTKDWNTDKNKSSRFCFASCDINNVRSFSSSLGSASAPQDGFTPNALFNLSVCEVSYRNKRFTLLNEGNTFVRNLNYATFGSETSHIVLLQNYNSIGTEGAIYEYRHKKGNIEYRLIPCLDSNNTPCMYDVINNQAYYNSADSGSFTYKLYPQPTEIWSCGEYNATDGKYHILVQPQGGSIADITLTEPLRKVNNVADTIEFPSDTEGKAFVTRNFSKINLGDFFWSVRSTIDTNKNRYSTIPNLEVLPNCVGSVEGHGIATALCSKYNVISMRNTANLIEGIAIFDSSYLVHGQIFIYDSDANTLSSTDFKNYINEVELIYQITPTTELVDAPQIEEADSYTCVISQGGKAVSWSSFETNRE